MTGFFFGIIKSLEYTDSMLKKKIIVDKIYFNDLRFGQAGMEDPEAPFVYCYQLEYNSKGELEAIEMPRSFEKGGEMLGKVFSRMLGK